MNTGRTSAPAATKPEEAFFLPSFCDGWLVFAVMVITELLAFVIALVSPGFLEDPWGHLGLISLYMQWIALTSAVVLCVARPWLARLSNIAAGLISYLIVLLVTAFVSETAYWLKLTTSGVLHITTEDHAVFLLRSLTIGTVISAVVLRYLFLQHQWRQQLEAETRSRIQALQARIRPHFLFNSMNTIAALTRSRPETAEEAIQDLSDLFRASLSQSHDYTNLEEELMLAQRYLHIEALRLGERLTVEWGMDTVPRDVRVPPLILQPLLENAIYHGIEPLPQGGSIRVNGRIDNGQVVIDISNPVGDQKAAAHHNGTRIAQANISQRLQLAFGKQAGLNSLQENGYYQVTIRFPEERLS